MADENPILNNPYEEPVWHYATNLQGELDYSRPVKGRRVFTPEVQTIPEQQGVQGDLIELNGISKAEHGKAKKSPSASSANSAKKRPRCLRCDALTE